MILLALLTSFYVHAKANTQHPQGQSIVWAFTSAPDRNPTIQNSLVTNKHELFRLYYKNLSDYNHSVFSGSIPRIEQELKARKLVCYPGSSDADRRKAFSYLTPQYIQPSPKLITRKDIAEKLLKNGQTGVSLRELIRNPEYSGLVAESRSFGTSIDRIISEKPNNLRSQLLDTFSSATLQMIASKKADYSIEYGFIFKSQQGENIRYKNIVEVPISDVDSFMTQYLACSKTPEGLAVIKRADQVIRENIKNPSYWKGVLESIPENERGPFQKEIDSYISERIKAPIIIE